MTKHKNKWWTGTSSKAISPDYKLPWIGRLGFDTDIAKFILEKLYPCIDSTLLIVENDPIPDQPDAPTGYDEYFSIYYASK
jgi:hypothetical protein